MTDEPNQKPKDADADGPAAAPETPAPDESAALRLDVAELRDRLLRAAAEMENIRRRQTREIADARQYALTAFAGDLLGVGDSLGRALATAATGKSADAAAIAGLVEGVGVTDRELHRVFEKHGIRKFSPAGEKFDPHRHQAMFEVESADVAPGTVTQVMQTGYAIGDRILRPALVGVSKAAPLRAPETAAAPDAGEGRAPESSDQRDAGEGS